VKKGDNLYQIGKKYGVTVESLVKLNKLNTNNLSIGQTLKIKPETKKPSKKPSAQTTTTTSKPKKEVPKTEPVITPTLAEENKSPNIGEPIPQNLPEDYYHVTLPKENLFRIALNANITLPELLKFNNFPDDHVVIKPGQKLVVKDPSAIKPSESNVGQTVSTDDADQKLSASPAPEDSVVIEKVYIVQRKDTLFKIARDNNMTVEELKRLNHITDNAIKVGQKLYIIAPKGKVVNEVVPVIVTEEELKSKVKIRTDLIMPVEGKVISEYGIRNGRPHKGIDLGAPAGNPIYAVLDGTVVYSGLQGNYGNVVVIEHPDYIMSVYGHNEKNLVTVGDIVKQGQIIATTGSTGNATTTHVHFEYRIKGKAINPRKVLPIGQ
jgi:murein DD-endopeptidase MepM/ murein hydrolase activator NlpD